jgi:hypothetical protein
MQKDASFSRLYWFTDLDAARKEAAAQDRPILSLRLLGNLHEDLSCANSRFFRTTLYSNASVSNYLRDNFVLHWESVRPVPILRIDLGNGRKIERTITGNSFHYILDAHGQIVDALPGLYGAEMFTQLLQRAASTARATAQLNDSERSTVIQEYHKSALNQLRKRWEDDLRQAGLQDWAFPGPMPAGIDIERDAAAATRITFAKGRVEAAPLRQITRQPADPDDTRWSQLAALYSDSAPIDLTSHSLIRAKQGGAAAANRLAVTKAALEDPLLPLIINLTRSITEDSVRNEYALHSQIHGWFATQNAPDTLEQFTEKVYAELFLMPGSDPWLGLAPKDAFSALDHAGLISNAQ